MSETISLGQSLRKAFHFLQDIHRDIYTMLTTLETAMDDKGWSPTEKGKISNDLSNRLTTDEWQIRSLYRIYAPAAQRKTTMTDRIIAIHVELDPPDIYDEPVC